MPADPKGDPMAGYGQPLPRPNNHIRNEVERPIAMREIDLRRPHALWRDLRAGETHQPTLDRTHTRAAIKHKRASHDRRRGAKN
jgi:hypothetical protein